MICSKPQNKSGPVRFQQVVSDVLSNIARIANNCPCHFVFNGYKVISVLSVKFQVPRVQKIFKVLEKVGQRKGPKMEVPLWGLQVPQIPSLIE